MNKRYNPVFPEALAALVEAEAEKRFATPNDTIRAIVAEHLTGRCSAPSPLQAAPPSGPVPPASGHVPTPAKLKPKDHEALMRTMSDVELSAHLKDIGFFPKDGTHSIIQPSDPCLPDGRWWKHVIISNGEQRSWWRQAMAKDGTEEKDNRYRESETTEDLMRAIKRKGLL